LRNAVLLGAALWLVGSAVGAQFEGVAGTLHNLSAQGPGEIRSLTETEVCKFCHVPHSAEEPVPLWGHALSEARYEVPQLRAGRVVAEPAPQPDGSSRLCLSCHDGTVALGDIAGEPSPIPMVGGERLGPSRPGHIGTDLSGSHPVSFVVRDLDVDTFDRESDMGLRPLGAMQSDDRVRLDAEGKMQCTTCHDPHSDRFYQPGRVPRFWVKATVSEVCLTCHVPR
jgi:hypothetical protein